MIVDVPRAVMALAVSCLGNQHREWALAMQAEFEAAEEDGRPVSFALGCLLAAWRELPMHEEGRLMMGRYFLSFALIIPMAALLGSSILADFPYSYLEQVGTAGSVRPAGGEAPLLNEATRSAVPSLAALVILITIMHFRVAWLVLERDWARTAAAGTLLAAATVTLTIFTGVVFVDCSSALTLAAMLIVELGSVSALARWHARPFGGSSELSA